MNELYRRRRSLIRKNIAYRQALEDDVETVKEEVSKGTGKLLVAGGVVLAGLALYKVFQLFNEEEKEYIEYQSADEEQQELIREEVARQTKASFGKRIGKAAMLLLLGQAKTRLGSFVSDKFVGDSDTEDNITDELEDPTA